MKSGEKRTLMRLLLAKEDIMGTAQNLEGIEKENCTDETWRLIEESIECLEMASKFLERIDLSVYDRGCDGHNGEDVVLRKKRERIKRK